MKEKAPEKAEELMQSHITNRTRRDWPTLTKMVTVWSRRSEVADTSKLKEVCKRKFFKKNRDLGYDDDRIKKKWEAATTAEKFRQGLARREGKRVFCFLPKAMEITRSDILSQSLEGEREESFMAASTAKTMLRGRQSLQLEERTKKQAFGGIFSLKTITRKHNKTIEV